MRWLLVCSAWLLSTAAFAQNPVNPHLALVPSNGIFHYQVRIQELDVAGLSSWQEYNGGIAERMDTQLPIEPLLDVMMVLQEQILEDSAVLGLDHDGWATAYPVGSTFMVRLDVADSERTRAWLNQTFQAQDITVRAESVTEGHWWELLVNAIDQESSAWVALTSQHLVLAISAANVDQNTLLTRLWGEPLTPSLATVSTVADVQAKYGFLSSQLGWLDVVELARTLVGVEPTLLAREWQRDADPDFGTPTAICEAEWLSLAEQSPRLVIGLTQYNTSDDAIDAEGKLVVELSNTAVQQEIGRLQGSLPNDLTDTERSLFSMGVGMNMDAFSPVVVGWWQRIAQQTWSCPTLQELQQEVAAFDPTTLAVATAIMQGSQSVLLDVFALGTLDDDTASTLNQLGDIDALLAVKTRDPFLLAAILGQNIPFLNGIVVPATGDAVPLPIPFPGLRVEARVVGDYLVVYQGAQARARAATLNAVPHSPAFIRAAVDAAPVIRQFERQMIDWMPSGSMTAESCESIRSSIDELSRYEHVVGGVEVRTADSGVQWQQQAQLRRGTQAASGPAAGTFELAILEDDCRWSPIGIEQLNGDQSAQYGEPDRFANPTCNLYETRYEWRVTGNALVWANSESRARNSCEETFADWTADAEDTECELLRQFANGAFECRVFFDGTPERFRYTPIRSE